MISAKTGVAFNSDTHAAAVEATTAAFEINKNLLVAIVLASSEYDPESVLSGVRSVIGESVQIVGATTAGEITESGPTKKKSIAVMLLYGSNVTAYTAVGKDIATDAHAAGAEMATSLQKISGKAQPKFVILFDDVLTGNGADIVRGVQSVFGQYFPIMGGAAGDDFNFKTTYQFHNNEVLTSSVVGLALVGDVSFGVGVRHGWIPVGLPMKVTKSDGAVVYELDGKPAIDAYRDYFGETVAKELLEETLAKSAITYPLGMKLAGSDEYLIRDPLSVSENGAITCAAEIPEGTEIRIMLGNKDEAIKHAKIAAEQALTTLGTQPSAVLIFNCIARNKLFAQDAGQEIAAVQSVLGNDVPLIGFYTYGEQAPLLGESRHIEECEASFHNETIVIVTLA